MRIFKQSSFRIALCISACITIIARSDDSQDRSNEAMALTRDIARSIHVMGGENQTTELPLVDSPLQRFSNPVVGEFYAHLFIWTHEGRPAAAASIQKWYAPKQALHVELQSLATQSIAVEHKSDTIWHPEEAGVEFTPIPNAAAPAKVAPARRLEMRRLAREFQVRVKAANRGGDVDEELRLLGQPIYRYKPKGTSILDGAIFSFVRGTDPELLLLIEAHATGDGYSWKYALAPMNSFEFQVLHQEVNVWNKPQLAPPWTNVMDPTKSYLLIPNFDTKRL